MTRQHFIKLAEELLASRPIDHAERIGWEAACRAVADASYSFNALFDRPRFLSACGFDYPA